MYQTPVTPGETILKEGLSVVRELEHGNYRFIVNWYYKLFTVDIYVHTNTPLKSWEKNIRRVNQYAVRW